MTISFISGGLFVGSYAYSCFFFNQLEDEQESHLLQLFYYHKRFYLLNDETSKLQGSLDASCASQTGENVSIRELTKQIYNWVCNQNMDICEEFSFVLIIMNELHCFSYWIERQNGEQWIFVATS